MTVQEWVPCGCCSGSGRRLEACPCCGALRDAGPCGACGGAGGRLESVERGEGLNLLGGVTIYPWPWWPPSSAGAGG
jgi:hypothetical protein